MRIISGQFKGRKLMSSQGIRPTEDKVKKALFDILRPVVPGSRFLDLYAGSGAVGIEALSEGAIEAYFVDTDTGNTKIIETNLNSLKTDAKAYKILNTDADKAIEALKEHKEMFDLIFLDPPYYKGEARPGATAAVVTESLAKKTLQTLGAYDILTRNGFIIVQYHRREKLLEEVGQLKLWRTNEYSTTKLSFYCKTTNTCIE